jgi:hypothetical protein
MEGLYEIGECFSVHREVQKLDSKLGTLTGSFLHFTANCSFTNINKLCFKISLFSYN